MGRALDVLTRRSLNVRFVSIVLNLIKVVNKVLVYYRLLKVKFLYNNFYEIDNKYYKYFLNIY